MVLVGPLTYQPLKVVFGFLWPAYQTHKAVAMSKLKLQEYWCQYWLTLGLFLAMEWLMDTFVFWLPLYHEAKLLLIVFLWHPRTQGAAITYERLVHPLLSSHEATIDRSLEETRARITDSVTGQISKVKEYAYGNAGAVLENLRQFSEQGGKPPAAGTQQSVSGRSHPHKT